MDTCTYGTSISICSTQAHIGTIEETDFKIYYYVAFVHAGISHGF